MCNFKNERVKKEKGITLIALVITIIILLILAGISIATLTGPNGLLSQASEAKERTGRAKVIEQAQLDVMDKKAGNEGNITKKQMKEVLDEYFNNVPDIEDSVTGKENDFWLNYPNGEGNKLSTNEEYGKYEIDVEEIYNGKFADDTKGILADELTINDYGKYVNYPIDVNGQNGYLDDWKIFYVGEDEQKKPRVFIISSEYVPSDHEAMVIAAKPENANLNRNTIYNMYFNVDEKGIQEISRKELFMATKYSLSNEYSNSKNISRMLHTENWKSFVKSQYAECAIGGPTLEMWVKSWNSHEDKEKYPYMDLGVAEDGYTLDINGKPYNAYYTAISNVLDKLYFPYDYFIEDPDQPAWDTNGYWLASPMSENRSFPGMVDLARFGGDGMMRNYYYAFRPVVCLNGDVRLEWNEANQVFELIK